MKRFFKPLFWFTVCFGTFKVLFALYNLINPIPLAKIIISGAGVESLIHSDSMAQNMGGTITPFIWGLLITSILVLISAFMMNKEMKTGYWLYILTNVFLFMFFFYGGFNLFPGLEYLSVFPLLGAILYTLVLDKFWDKSNRV